MWFQTLDMWIAWMSGPDAIHKRIIPEAGGVGWDLVGFDMPDASWEKDLLSGSRFAYWTVRALVDHLGIFSNEEISELEQRGVRIFTARREDYKNLEWKSTTQTISWAVQITMPEIDSGIWESWMYWASGTSMLAHELMHAIDNVPDWNPKEDQGYEPAHTYYEGRAIYIQNQAQAALQEWNPVLYDWLWASVGASYVRPGGLPVGPPGNR